MSDAPTRSFSPHGDPTADPPAHDATRDLNDPTATPGERGAGDTPPPTPEGYELLEEVGSGGMGVVYRAREIALDRDVAVKFLQGRYSAHSPSARRFLDEARITGQLQHPAIPPIHHIGTLPDGRPFLVMKLIKGDTLAQLLEDDQDKPGCSPDNRARLVPVFAQVCQAVAYAHARKVIHRDLKPANVMVGAFGEVQVMDWGLAKVLTDQPEAPEPTAADDGLRTEIRTSREPDSATQAGSVLGTPAFMSPEQAGGEVSRVDERSDVFGLGAVLCAILTGQPPYWRNGQRFHPPQGDPRRDDRSLRPARRLGRGPGTGVAVQAVSVGRSRRTAPRRGRGGERGDGPPDGCGGARPPRRTRPRAGRGEAQASPGAGDAPGGGGWSGRRGRLRRPRRRGAEEGRARS